MLGCQCRRRHQQRIGQSDQNRERCAQIVRNARQQDIAQTLGLHLQGRGLGDLDVMHALERDGDEAREGVEQAPLLGRHGLIRVAWCQDQHAAGAHRRLERDIQQCAPRQGIGPAAGLVLMLEGPAANGRIDRQVGGRGQETSSQLGPVVGQHQDRAGAELGFSEALADPGDLLRLERPRQIARQLIERAGAVLTPAGHPRLVAHPGRQVSGDESNAEHDGKGEQVLHVIDRERQTRRDEEQIERDDVRHGGQDRGAESEAGGHHHDRQEEEHDDVGGRKDGVQWCGGGGGRHADEQALRIGRPGCLESLAP